MQFTFKAENSKGALVEGTREAADKLSLLADLKGEGLSLLAAEPASGAGMLKFLAWLNELVVTVSLHEKIVFARNLAAMVAAGLPISRGIEVLEKQTTNGKFKKVLSAVGKTIKDGGSLSDGLKKYPSVFPPLMVAMVHAGEESGGLAPALREAGVHLEKHYALVKKVRGAMIYPAIIICAIVVIGALMLIYVVPTLTATFKELKVELPASTKLIIFISDLLTDYTIPALLGIAAIGGAFFLALRTPRGKRALDLAILKLPLIGNLAKEVNSARTARTLSSLLTAGVSVTDALAITKDVLQNSYYKEALESAGAHVQKGGAISDMFKSHEALFPVMVGEMAEVGEETGKLSEMLVDIASFYEGEVEAATKDLSIIIEPVLMVVIGAAVGFFAISMISPTYSLLNNI
ncbi:MAG: type II secretion system F family protein [bacterium]|nr:type II secretion system F family protein [bacterium]